MRTIINKIIQDIEIDYVHDLAKKLSLVGNEGGSYGFRTAGSTGEWKVAEMIKAEMLNIGLSNVEADTFPVHTWEFLTGEIQIKCNHFSTNFNISSFPGTRGTNGKAICAEIVDVGSGLSKDYKGKDVNEKIVLVTMDFNSVYWFDAIFKQAHIMGAKGCLIIYAGNIYGVREDALNSAQTGGDYSISVGCLTRKDGKILKELLFNEKVFGELIINSSVDFSGKSSNIVGTIEGIHDDRYLIISSHMDGFFNSYQDDLLGTAMSLGLAKAIIRTNQKPKHTIVVIAHGSEEYGVSGISYDWCIGSWYSINVLRKEWLHKTTAFFNIDAISPDAKAYNMNCSTEYHCFLKKYLNEKNNSACSLWPEGIVVNDIINGLDTDDYNYSIKGVPCIIGGRGNSEWMTNCYHTQFDDYNVFESERSRIEYIMINYMEMIAMMDATLLPPLNFVKTIIQYHQTLEICGNEVGNPLAKELIIKAKKAVLIADRLYQLIKKYNLLLDANISETNYLRRKLFECNEIIRRDLIKLSTYDNLAYEHEAIYSNIKALEKALIEAKKNNIDICKHHIGNVDLGQIRLLFDEEVYRHMMLQQDNKRKDLFMATERWHEMVSIESIIEKIDNSELLIKEMGNLLEYERKLLTKVLEREKRTFVEIMEGMIKLENRILSNGII